NIFLDIIHVKDSVSWLMQAYVLCREVPGLLQKGSNNSRSSVTGLLSFPTSIEEIAKHANQVLKGLPAMTIAVISLLDNTFTTLIQEIFSCKDIKTWILVSRLSFEKEPVVVLLPIYF
ncbi:hypothetical protein RYX36_033020, partial [Vicia faba]